MHLITLILQSIEMSQPENSTALWVKIRKKYSSRTLRFKMGNLNECDKCDSDMTVILKSTKYGDKSPLIKITKDFFSFKYP